MDDKQTAERIIERALQTAREEARKSAIPENVRKAWEKIRSHIIHDGEVDTARFDLEDFFDGKLAEESELYQWRKRREERQKNRYRVEKQADNTWAIFLGGGFVKGGYRTSHEAAYAANEMITADREAGVPVEMGVENA